TLDDRRFEPGVDEASQDAGLTGHLGQMQARLRALAALADGAADPKAPADQLGEVEPARCEIAPALPGGEGDPVLVLEPLGRLGLDQRPVVALGAAVVAIAAEAEAGIGEDLVDRRRLRAALRGDVDLLDGAGAHAAAATFRPRPAARRAAGLTS